MLLEKLARLTEALASYTRAAEITPKYALLDRCVMLNQLLQYTGANLDLAYIVSDVVDAV